MIVEITDLKQAQELCDKIHSYLLQNCKGYNASCWQVPTKAPKEETYFVQLPQEFTFLAEKLVAVKEDLTEIKAITDKAILTIALPDKFKVIEDVTPIEIKPIIDEKIITDIKFK